MPCSGPFCVLLALGPGEMHWSLSLPMAAEQLNSFSEDSTPKMLPLGSSPRFARCSRASACVQPVPWPEQREWRLRAQREHLYAGELACGFGSWTQSDHMAGLTTHSSK